VFWERERESESEREGGKDIERVKETEWERQIQGDGNNETLLTIHNLSQLLLACRMMWKNKIKLPILIAKPIKLKWLCLLDFKRRRKFAKSGCYLRHVCLSVRLQQLRSVWEDFIETWYLVAFRKCVEEIQIPLKWTKIAGSLCEELSTFMVISGLFLFRTRNVSDKNWIKKHILLIYIYIYIYIYVSGWKALFSITGH